LVIHGQRAETSVAAVHLIRCRAKARLRSVFVSDAAAHGIAEGDIIRLFNARGACLAAVTLTDGTY
jgi:biotin/methionine sulfoxide reductase